MPRDRVMKILREEDSEVIAQRSLVAEVNSSPMVVIATYSRALKSMGLVPEMLRAEH